MITRSCVPVEIMSMPSWALTEKDNFRPSIVTSLTSTVTVMPGSVGASCEKLTWVPRVCSSGQLMCGLKS